MTAKTEKKYKKKGELPYIVCEIIAMAAKDLAIGENTPERKFAYHSSDQFWKAMKKFVDNTPVRCRQKDDRREAAGYKRVKDLPANLKHLEPVVKDRERARRAKRKRDQQKKEELEVSSNIVLLLM